MLNNLHGLSAITEHKWKLISFRFLSSQTRRLSENVILSETKNLTNADSYKPEILRLSPQNDILGQPPSEYSTSTLVFP